MRPDCGGPPGYFDFIENIARKQSKRAKEALEWYGGPYDPDDIDVEQINVTGRRPPSIDVTKVWDLKKKGLGASEIAKVLRIGRASVYRALTSTA
jgi:DNA invertase Pin-like site-specific DNA recombinase